MSVNFIVESQEAQFRLDKLLVSRFPKHSRQYFQYLIKQGLVLANGNRLKKGNKLEQGDKIEIEFAPLPEISLKPEPLSLEILFEDDHLIAINKPAGMVVHPAVGNWSGTLANGLVHYLPNSFDNNSLRPGIVHRLDKETSGILIATKEEQAKQLMVELFATRQIEKQYLAITIGNPGNRLIEGNIGRHPTRRKEMALLENKGRPAKTYCKTMAHSSFLSYVHLFPETGRTHQLRVHLKSIDSPVLGDSVYGNLSINKKLGAKRQLLHAYRLKFVHPFTKKEIELIAPIPQDMEKFIALMN